MDVDFDFSDIDKVFKDFEKEVQKEMEHVGKISIQYAKETGNYQDVTGKLRKSNEYEVKDKKLILKNEAENEHGIGYASFVESKGYDVLSSAALYAEKRLKEEFEK